MKPVLFRRLACAALANVAWILGVTLPLAAAAQGTPDTTPPAAEAAAPTIARPESAPVPESAASQAEFAARTKALQRAHAAVVGLDNHAPDDVRRHQIGRELNTRVLQLQGTGQGAEESRLAQPGHAFKKHVSARKHADEDTLDDIVLPYDYFGDFGLQPVN